MSIEHPLIKRYVSLINRVADNTANKYQRNITRQYGELGIWLAINYPAFKNLLGSLSKEFTNIKIPKDEFTYKSKLTKTEIWLIKKVLIFIKNKLVEQGSLYQYIKEDINATQNESCSYLIPIIAKEIEQLEDEELKKPLKILFDIFIWCMIRDTAYRDQFFWSLWQIGNKEIRELIKQHPTKLVRPPKLWYSTLWVAGKKESQEKRARGELKLGEFCDLESPCVPHIQNKEVKRGFRR